MIFTLIVILISLALVYDYARKKRRNDIAASIPGSLEIPIIGNYFIFIVRSVKDVMRLTSEVCQKYNGLAKSWDFNKLDVMITNPEYLEAIMSSSKHIKKSRVYTIMSLWLGEGLLTSQGSKWHARRKAITPAFHFKILEQFVDIFDQQSTILVEQLRKYSKTREAFNVYPYVTMAGLDIISETAMGVKLNAQTDPNNKYVKNVADISRILMQRLSNPFLKLEFLFKLFAPEDKATQDRVLRELHEFTEQVIEQRRDLLQKELAMKQKNEEDNDNIGVRKKMALLDILLQSKINGKPLSNADIREEVDTFMFAGHDTTTSGISFALHLLSRHPEIQKKLVDEIYDVIGTDKNKPVTYADLQRLKYIECVLKESMRLHPPVPIIGREVTEDTKIGIHTIPAGTGINVPIFVMMKNPKYFPDPEKFDPDRHLLENSLEKSNPYAYIPFSAGPRNCMGQKFAMLEMKSIITKILRHYELLPLGEEVDPVINLVMKSTNGIQLGIKP